MMLLPMVILAQFNGPSVIITLGYRAPSCAIWCTIGPYQKHWLMYERDILLEYVRYFSLRLVHRFNLCRESFVTVRENVNIHRFLIVSASTDPYNTHSFVESSAVEGTSSVGT